MKRNGLLTPQDVVDFTPVQEPFSPCTLQELYLIEYGEAETGTCLGGLWHAMVAALADYTEARQYRDRADGYLAGEVVTWKGGYRVARTDTIQAPDNRDHWRDAPKFIGPCADFYADLYCNFVGPYLAFVVISERLPYLITQITDRGMSYGGRAYNGQDESLMKSVYSAVFRDRNKTRAILDSFLTGQSSLPANTACLIGWPGLVLDKDALHSTACGCANPTCHGNPCSEAQPRTGYRFSVSGG